MTRAAQNLLMLLVGMAVLWITLVTGEVVNYVKPGLRYPLVGCAVLLIVLGVAGLRRDWHDHDEHDEHDGHHHGPGGPKVAWLLLLPVIAIFAVSPPELGVFTASRSDARSAAPPPLKVEDYSLPASPDPLPMTLAEFSGRSYEAQVGGEVTLTGRRVKLTGFATPGKNGTWTLNRLQVGCCAADALPTRVTVKGAPAPAKGSWVDVVGVWTPAGTPQGDPVNELKAETVTPTKKPSNPYE